MLLAAGIILAALASCYFSTLTYALRDFSRARLEDFLARSHNGHLLGRITDNQTHLIFITAVWRLLANVLMVAFTMLLFQRHTSGWATMPLAIIVSLGLGLIFSVTIPTALALYMGELAIATSVKLLHALRLGMLPLARLMDFVDAKVRKIAGRSTEAEPEQIEKDILSVVQEGVKEGVVDTQERQMIESVIQFRDTDVSQTMTARPEIIALELSASLEEVKRTIEQSGHSRLPVYDGTLDHILGILYARDLLKHLGEPPEKFNIRDAMRPAIFVPETKPLRDLLKEFRVQKVHIAIVLDEYGGTAGLVTIEDILEELVGEISDEHEPAGLPSFRRISEGAFEVDARMYIGDLNHRLPLKLPDDAGYETVGGFVSTTLGRIPQKGVSFEQNHARFTILDAEPQVVKRVKIEMLPQGAANPVR
jgi:putative hemolysin